MTDGFYAKLWVFVYSIIFPLIAGYLIKKIAKIPKEKFDILLKINFAVFMPLTLALSFWKMNVTRDIIFLPLIGFIVPVAGAVFGFFLSKNRYKTNNERGSFIVSSMLSNRLNVGGLSAYIIFGEAAYIYVNLILLFQAVNNYVIGHTIGNYFGNRDKMKKGSAFKAIFLRITNISIIGMILGLVLKFAGVPRPEVMADVVDIFVKIVAWLSLMVVGAAIEFRNALKYYKDIPRMFLVKFVLLPIVAAGLAFWLLNDKIAIATVIITGIAPVAINAVVVAKMNNLNQAVTINSFLSTSLFYLIIIFPILLWVSQKLFA